ncbi:Crp/Fnr family transcriptional regulator (plasmid) [Methylobacterium radiotolerans]|jgi:CRP-like cAMP-binding protein|uniref:Crp/Fnr family transcriptional regulator n=1 Tax=Methylobacterium TaxID=407 RepID=UPI0005E27D99|nr:MULTISPECIES: Crp/Fnr family transcriptional regulator [Methylobacterium]MBN6819825.1 Crp/Fnr family transcriptional regulator [Methylobacterium organophilum]OXE43035.1 Crp/Fnr family transcriptional regulator [Methylobacterium radiotolerans]GAN48738.1 Crp/FNR family transcriptional regulator [Methylobacterium sp. ME121]
METVVPMTVTDTAVSRRIRPPRPSAPVGSEPRSALIRKLEGLAPLTVPDRAALAGLTRYVRPIARHTALVEQDGVAEHALIVAAGFAGRLKRCASGRRQILAYLIPGDLCDRGAIHGYPLDHTIETLTPCRIAEVPRAVYFDLLDRHPGIALALQRAKLTEEATAREWMANIAMRSGPERMAHLLCELLERLGSIGETAAGQFDMPLTQRELAETLGLSSVHVNRVLQVLRRDGLITLRGRRLRILAPRQLRQLAEFEAGYLSPSYRARGAGTRNGVRPPA